MQGICLLERDPKNSAEGLDPIVMSYTSPREGLETMTISYATPWQSLATGRLQDQWWKPEVLSQNAKDSALEPGSTA